MNPLPKWFLLLFRYEGVRVDNVQHLQVLHLFVFFEYYGYFPFAKCLVAPFERNFLVCSWSFLYGVYIQHLSKDSINRNTLQFLGDYHFILHIHTKQFGPKYIFFKRWLIWGRRFYTTSRPSHIRVLCIDLCLLFTWTWHVMCILSWRHIIVFGLYFYNIFPSLWPSLLSVGVPMTSSSFNYSMTL